MANRQYTVPQSSTPGSGGGGGGGTVTSVTGTTNQIDVATGTTTPVISIDPALILPSGTTATTQSSGDSSTHPATTAFVNAPLSTNAGQGGFWGGIGGSFGILPFAAVSTTDTGNWLTSNQVWVFQFELAAPHAVGHIVTRVAASSVVAGSIFDTGVYTVGGSLLCNTGGLDATSVSTKNTALGAQITVPKGVYYFAFVLYFPSGAGTTFAPLSATFGTNGFVPFTTYQVNGSYYATAANAATLGVLPPTLGALTTKTSNSTDVPVVLFTP